MSTKPLLFSPVVDDGASLNEGGQKQSSTVGAFFAIMCTMAGAGILQLPYTLKQGGWLCVLLIVIVGIMTHYTGQLLIQLLYSSETGFRLSGYPAIGREAYGRAGELTVHVFHKATLLGVCTLFLILAGKFFLEGVGGGGEGLWKDIGDDPVYYGRLYTLISAGLVCLPVIGFKTLGEIAPLAAFGIFTSVLCVVIIITVSWIIYPIADAPVASPYDLPGISNSNFTAISHVVVGDLSDTTSAFSAIILSFGGHAVFPTIEQHMKDRSRFPLSFRAAYAVLLVMYVVVATSGYLVFGDATYSPIFCNFPRDDSVVGQITCITKIVIALHVITAYPMLMTVVANELEDGLHIEKPSRSTVLNILLRSLLRLALVATTCVIAVLIPFFPEFMSLVGALCLTMIVFVLPVVFSWKLKGGDIQTPERVWGVFIVLVGVLGGATGSYLALLDIVNKLNNGDHE